jgi:hypothetical protein
MCNDKNHANYNDLKLQIEHLNIEIDRLTGILSNMVDKMDHITKSTVEMHDNIRGDIGKILDKTDDIKRTP